MKKILARALPFVLGILPISAFATANTLDNPLHFTTLQDFLAAILQLVVTIGTPIIVLFIVFLGFRFVAASGNAEELKKIRTLFFWALVGALIVLGAEAISIAIRDTVNQLQRGV
jgi:amino acid transporter